MALSTISPSKQQYMDAYEAAVVRLDPAAAGRIDWYHPIAAYSRNPDNSRVGGKQDAEKIAADLVARGLHLKG